MDWPKRRARLQMLAVAAMCASVTVAIGAFVWHSEGVKPIEVTLTSWLVAPNATLPPLNIWELRHLHLALLVLPGEPLPFCLALLAFGLLSIRHRDPWAGALAIVAPIISVILASVIGKPLVERSGHGGVFIYPSGHSAAASSLALVAYVLIFRWHGRSAAHRALPWLLAIPFLTGFGLIVLRWHLPLDVPGGWGVGGAVVLGMSAVLLSGDRRPTQATDGESGDRGSVQLTGE